MKDRTKKENGFRHGQNDAALDIRSLEERLGVKSLMEFLLERKRLQLAAHKDAVAALTQS